MALLPWRKKRNDSIRLAHGEPANLGQPVTVNDSATASGPLSDAPSNQVKIFSAGADIIGGRSASNPLENPDHQYDDQRWWAAHYPYTVHDADGDPKPHDVLAKTTPIQINVSDDMGLNPHPENKV